MMELDILLKSVSVVRVEGDTARNITGINMDSRLVQPGDLFAPSNAQTYEPFPEDESAKKKKKKRRRGFSL